MSIITTNDVASGTVALTTPAVRANGDSVRAGDVKLAQAAESDATEKTLDERPPAVEPSATDSPPSDGFERNGSAAPEPTRWRDEQLAPILIEGQDAPQNASEQPIEGYRANASNALGVNLPLRQTPASVSVVSNDFLEDAQIQRLDDLRNTIPGVLIGDTGGSSGESPLIRSFQLDTVFTDGLPSAARFDIPPVVPQFLERIEISGGRQVPSSASHSSVVRST